MQKPGCVVGPPSLQGSRDRYMGLPHTNPAGARRLASKPASARSAKPAADIAVGGCMSCSTRMLGGQHETNTQDLQRVGPLATQQVTRAKVKAELTERPRCSAARYGLAKHTSADSKVPPMSINRWRSASDRVKVVLLRTVPDSHVSKLSGETRK